MIHWIALAGLAAHAMVALCGRFAEMNRVRRFLAACGQSYEKLERRRGYGGRKGRSAARRLRSARAISRHAMKVRRPRGWRPTALAKPSVLLEHARYARPLSYEDCQMPLLAERDLSLEVAADVLAFMTAIARRCRRAAFHIASGNVDFERLECELFVEAEEAHQLKGAWRRRRAAAEVSE